MLYVCLLHSYNMLYKSVLQFCGKCSIGSAMTQRCTHSGQGSWEAAGHGVGDGEEATHVTCSSRDEVYQPMLVVYHSNARPVAAGIAASA
jgi:hypothetical protein